MIAIEANQWLNVKSTLAFFYSFFPVHIVFSIIFALALTLYTHCEYTSSPYALTSAIHDFFSSLLSFTLIQS